MRDRGAPLKTYIDGRVSLLDQTIAGWKHTP